MAIPTSRGGGSGRGSFKSPPTAKKGKRRPNPKGGRDQRITSFLTERKKDVPDLEGPQKKKVSAEKIFKLRKRGKGSPSLRDDGEMGVPLPQTLQERRKDPSSSTTGLNRQKG